MYFQPAEAGEEAHGVTPHSRRLILLAGAFAALLFVIAGSSYAIWQNALLARQHVEDVRVAQMGSRTALATLRANVYLIGILTRDYLLDPKPENEEIYVRQFAEVKAQSEEAFGVLESSAQTEEERSALRLLRSEIEENWDPAGFVLNWKAGERERQRAALMEVRLQQRQEIVALAESVDRMITGDFAAERARVARSDEEFQRSLGWIIAVSLILTFGIAAATFMRMFALGRQSERAESELRLLSGQILTAQEEERKRLSRELHDQVGQMLTGLRMELALIARHGNAAPEEFSTRIARAKQTAEETLEIVRNIAMLLRPSMLDDIGLTPAINWLAHEMSRSSGIPVRSDVDARADQLPDRHRTCLYRVIQEALTNVTRHSRASSAEVTLKMSPDWITAVVSDNGRGFEEGRSRGLGLVGIGERVRELGGSLRVQSANNAGTRIEIRVPNPDGVTGRD